MTALHHPLQITLVIDNPEQLLHGCTPVRQFDRVGGSIGSVGCDWRLNDRQHRVQPQHCELRLREGRFCVIDVCGQTRLNGHDLALGLQTTIRLNDGDRLHIGAYIVIVHLHNADITSHSRQQTVSALLRHSESPLDALLDGFVPPSDVAPAVDMTSRDLLQLIRPADAHASCDPLLALEASQPPARATTLTLDLFDPPQRDAPAVAEARIALSEGMRPAIEQRHWSSPDDSAPCVTPRPGTGSHSMMARALMLLTACLLLGGCTMLGKLGQVIISPSTPVGGPDEQPTRITLSLHATRTVNPNPAGVYQVPDATLTTSPTAYGATVSAGSSVELTDKLYALLDHLQTVAPAHSPLLDDVAQAGDAPLMSPAQPAVLGTYSDPLVTLTLPNQPSALAPGPEQLATPIAFKILQLKDDSLLLNATAQALAADLKQALGSTYIQDDDYLLTPGQFKFINYQAINEDTRYLAVIARYHDANTAQWKHSVRLEPTGRTYALLVQLDEARVELKAEHP
ncbi:type VI secretion system lipoprotein TssJ [Pseudomonas fluorescens]|uniref:FHA domain-containing protein n=1 Tax=Pseudomonas fluorescens TaxID=294 RepID=A0A5E7C9T8_PSEFL|nr:type VI secretion system lipoprotein TssJ [Pseudomonas fluorescens]VVN92501.1 hypothetical protein PS723_01985 [Pseudomonas fluorescens]